MSARRPMIVVVTVDNDRSDASRCMRNALKPRVPQWWISFDKQIGDL